MADRSATLESRCAGLRPTSSWSGGYQFANIRTEPASVQFRKSSYAIRRAQVVSIYTDTSFDAESVRGRPALIICPFLGARPVKTYLQCFKVGPGELAGRFSGSLGILAVVRSADGSEPSMTKAWNLSALSRASARPGTGRFRGWRSLPLARCGDADGIQTPPACRSSGIRARAEMATSYRLFAGFRPTISRSIEMVFWTDISNAPLWAELASLTLLMPPVGG